jgi:S-adenosylmethionine hydrolase
MREPIISLTTDFGEHDPFVGIMKGVILGINPSVQIVDLCHQVPAHRILEASFLLNSSYRYFPFGTIHVVVVDPGVGSRRRPILVQTPQFFFVAPDNGVLSYLYQEQPDLQVFHLTESRYFRPEISQTFHGRDIFAPAAAWLSTGLSPHALGPRIQDYLQLEVPEPRCLAPHVFEFQIIHIDTFGNLITNIGQDFFFSEASQDQRQGPEQEQGQRQQGTGATPSGQGQGPGQERGQRQQGTGAAPSGQGQGPGQGQRQSPAQSIEQGRGPRPVPGQGQRFLLEIASQTVSCLQTHYAAVNKTLQVGAIFGSTGNLEIFANKASASQILHVDVGDAGRITFA